MDRIKTPKVIESSLRELMKKYSFDKITVSQICEYSHISRQLFYYYYKDKFDIVNQYYQTEANQLVDTLRGQISWELVLNEILVHLKEEEALYTCAFKSDGQNAFPSFLEKYTYDMHSRLIIAQSGPESMTKPMRFSLEFYCHSAAYMATKWGRTKMKESTDYMAERLISNLPKELSTYFI